MRLIYNVSDQGMRRLKTRSVLVVNEQFSNEHNAVTGHERQTLIHRELLLNDVHPFMDGFFIEGDKVVVSFRQHFL